MKFELYCGYKKVVNAVFVGLYDMCVCIPMAKNVGLLLNECSVKKIIS